MTTVFTSEEILAQLDQCAANFTFPMLDNGYVYLADVRMEAYRDEARWALVIEVIGVHNRASGHDCINNCLHVFGNCLKRPPGTANEDFPYLTDDGADCPTFVEDSLDIVCPEATAIRVRRQEVEFTLHPSEFAKRGIDLESADVHSHELLRLLIGQHRERFVATEEELRDRIPPDLPMVLRLDEWHHPDLAGGDLPSRSETFQMIAEVLVTGDPARYRPTKTPNTHWRDWPEGGTL
jgi:hypothetical protein